MLHRVTLLQRNSSLSPSAFSRHWRTHHADIVKRMPDLVHYAQNHVVAAMTAGEPAFPVAGVVETWHRSGGHADLADSAPDDFTALLEDELHLLSGSAALQIRSQPEPLPEPSWKIWLHSPRADERHLSGFVRPPGLPGLLDERLLLRDTTVPMLTREHLSAPRETPGGVIALAFDSEHRAREAMDAVTARAAATLDMEDLQLLLTHEHRVL
ncbi:EthD domain-containing protein [Streptomyces canus]|uniref:EthD domain-containing protein n=1 Tax=Streptomyces canus TaxID=58343 RepID=UPI0033B7067B